VVQRSLFITIFELELISNSPENELVTFLPEISPIVGLVPIILTVMSPLLNWVQVFVSVLIILIRVTLSSNEMTFQFPAKSSGIGFSFFVQLLKRKVAKKRNNTLNVVGRLIMVVKNC
jgi:hypothetical protein